VENAIQISLFPEVDISFSDYFADILVQRYNDEFITQMMKPSIFQQFLPGGKHGKPKVPKMRVQVQAGTRKRKTSKKLCNLPKRHGG
jgi:hypothetical protein